MGRERGDQAPLKACLSRTSETATDWAKGSVVLWVIGCVLRPLFQDRLRACSKCQLWIRIRCQQLDSLKNFGSGTSVL